MTAARKLNDMIAMMAVTVAVISIGSSFPIEGIPSNRLPSVRGPSVIARFPCCAAQLLVPHRSRGIKRAHTGFGSQHLALFRSIETVANGDGEGGK
jgi:hypothetical protein